MTTPLTHNNNPRRVLRASEAALYCGVSKGTFAKWIKKSRMPVGMSVDGCVLWDIKALDFALDELFNGNEADKPVGLREVKL